MAVENVFAVPVFFVIMRETIEAGIVLSILLSFVRGVSVSAGDEKADPNESSNGTSAPLTNKQLLRKLRIQVWAGALTGFFIALAIGGAFIGVFYSGKVRDLWAQSEEVWEGTFNLIASLLILPMAIAFLKLEQSKAKWKVKLAHAFEHRVQGKEDRGGRTSRWALFFLPFITVIREGLEAVVFAGGVSLSESGTSIPLAVVMGLIAGGIIAYLIYFSGSRVALHYFLIISTIILLLVGAGLFSTACTDYQLYVWNTRVGADTAELGTGAGSFMVKGNVWHLTYGNPEQTSNQGGGWGIFQSILGWTNNATIGSILCYCFYWIAVMAILTYMKWSEGRVAIFGLKSKMWYEREAFRRDVAERREGSGDEKLSADEKLSNEGRDMEVPAHEIV
ncbi:iron permease FTR1 [Clavulina sp. PMI_390]|nr:iron permease FTR1 [Clavulina sp. PMI_390]